MMRRFVFVLISLFIAPMPLHAVLVGGMEVSDPGQEQSVRRAVRFAQQRTLGVPGGSSGSQRADAFLQQRPCMFEVVRIETLGEPRVDRIEQLARGVAMAMRARSRPLPRI
jgi:hypothetical protein